MVIQHLQCEYATNPIGLDIADPQFSWQVWSDERGFLQSAYQIVVSDSQQVTGNDVKIIWNTGKVISGRSAGIRYTGPSLKSRERYYWLVKIWDSNDREYDSTEPAFFEMGLLSPSNWQAVWIGCPANRSGRVLYFRRKFLITEEISRARIYISGLGYYVLYINNQKVGDHVLDPGTSDYSKRILYTTYDIGDLLVEENVISVMVGPGWYGMPKLLLQAEITYQDGHTQFIPTCWDPYQNWLVTTGPIVRSSIFDGESYDAREENPGWALPVGQIDGMSRTNQWINAVIMDTPGGQMVSQLQEPIKIVNTLLPRSINQPAKGIYVIDAGQNLAGWAAIKVRGKRGTAISLKFAESLKPDGTVNQDNLRSAAAKDTYVMKGGDAEQWEPSFTYHGYRYIQVEGFPYPPTSDDIRIRVVRSAVDSSGKFSCSNELLNRIHQMVWWTEASNLHSIPTDCPQRDERMGWLNDMTVRIEQALYNFNLSRFYMKWIADIMDTQSADGAITDTAPFRWGFRPADPVSVSYLLLALKCYEFYGNERIILHHYQGLKAWIDYLTTRTEDGIVNYSYWGDWSPPEEFGTPGSVGSGAVSRYTPGDLISTGYLYYGARIISQMASVLGNIEDEISYQELGEQIAIAFNKAYWNEKTGGYGSNNQACNSFALFLGLVGKENIGLVVSNLVEDVKSHAYHLTTGNLCTKYLLETLTEYGYPEHAYKIVSQLSYPGWGYMLENGATTLWERWENKIGGEMNSHNHPMMGSVGSWFYKYLVGILPDLDGPGFEKFIIKPYILNDLEFVNGEYHSIKGTIKCAWKKESGTVYLDVTIPVNSTAKVFVPTKKRENITENNRSIGLLKETKFLRMEGTYAVYELVSGSYHFKSDW